ncbi:MAG: hypothetical protein K9W46_02965 [Candidatus Heimdallarchaeum endolithica]|uniref:Type II toxin-antitoxin system HicB family antitoxin n=1 Tax=Candidatus Heimdallarchaeum endolithica TaxID=2876572 RepID=A0A9Y1BSS3_9ARCH|nr:MAG: hypothetical protein K9W46_02965 [Candidatus Heimdallarchaeum endolithica]
MQLEELPIIISKDEDNLLFISCSFLEKRDQVVENIDDALDTIREALEIWLQK